VLATDGRARGGQPVYDLTAGSWASGTRVAASNPALWREIFTSNRDAVSEAIGDFQDALAALQAALRCGDDDQLEALLAAAQQAKLSRTGR